MPVRQIKMRRNVGLALPVGGSSVVRAVNPGPGADLRSLAAEGTKVLSEAIKRSKKLALEDDADLRRDALTKDELTEAQRVWQSLQLAWSTTEADRRTALTRLQTILRRWTEDDANFSSNKRAQALRRALHLALDH